MIELNPMIVNLDSKVEPAKLATILGYNVSLLYQHAQAGRLPSPLIDHTYLQCIQQYIKHYKKSAEAKVIKAEKEYELKLEKAAKDLELRESKFQALQELKEKEREKREEREREKEKERERERAELEQKRAEKEREKEERQRQKEASFGEDAMPPLISAKIKQEIRLNIAREAQIWQKAAIERGDYINLAELTELAEPFIMSIRNSLLSIAITSEEAQKQVDLVMENLFSLGCVLVTKAEEEQKQIVQTILDKEIDFTDIDHELENVIHL